MQRYKRNLWSFNATTTLLIAVLAVIIGSTRLEADVLIIDDDMSAPANYSFGWASSSPSSGVDFGFSSDGGNPGGFFLATHNHDVERDGDGAPLNGDGLVELYSFFTYLPTTYTPSESGSIETISFSVDVLYDDLAEDFNRVFFYVEDQNGAFLGGNADLFTSSEWQTITVNGLTEAAFPGRDFSGSLPLSFGFGFVSNTDVTSGPLSSSIIADNFRVSFTAVPEPGSMSLLAIFAGMAMGRFRRS